MGLTIAFKFKKYNGIKKMTDTGIMFIKLSYSHSVKIKPKMGINLTSPAIYKIEIR